MIWIFFSNPYPEPLISSPLMSLYTEKDKRSLSIEFKVKYHKAFSDSDF